MFDQFEDFEINKMVELQEYFDNFILEQDDDWIEWHKEEIHHYAFNEDYYIIGTHKAKQWLGDFAFDVIAIIKAYELENFGEVYTDLSNPEKVVNMYAYIVGQDIVSHWLEGAMV